MNKSHQVYRYSRYNTGIYSFIHFTLSLYLGSKSRFSDGNVNVGIMEFSFSHLIFHSQVSERNFAFFTLPIKISINFLTRITF